MANGWRIPPGRARRELGNVVNVLGRAAILLGVGCVFLWTWFDERFRVHASKRVRLGRGRRIVKLDR
jgi:hypothetical protein